MSEPRFEALGEDAVLVRLGDRIDGDVNRRVHAVAAWVSRADPQWLVEVVPAYASLALRVDPDMLDDGDAPLEHVRDWWRAQAFDFDRRDARALQPVEIPVCYGGEHGPDLAEVAAYAGLDEDEVISRHLAGDYCVAMLGFAPGFPYLIGLDPRLAMPRRETPRVRVPAGSVGIGGAQAGIYPREGPGGWRLVGRTPATLFDASREAPSLLAPGQPVRFVRIDAREFERRSGRRARARQA